MLLAALTNALGGLFGRGTDCVQVQCLGLIDICANSFEDATQRACDAMTEVTVTDGNGFITVAPLANNDGCTLIVPDTGIEPSDECNGEGIIPLAEMYVWRGSILAKKGSYEGYYNGTYLKTGGRILGCFAKQWVHC